MCVYSTRSTNDQKNAVIICEAQTVFAGQSMPSFMARKEVKKKMLMITDC